SPVVELNRAVAIGLAEGPEAGLAALDRIDGSALRGYDHLRAARAHFLRPLWRWTEAAAEHRRALALAENAREPTFLAATPAAWARRLGASRLAGRTRPLRAGPPDQPLPLHHPGRLDREHPPLDHLSHGRLDLGSGRGGDPGAYGALGPPYHDSQARLFEEL